MIIVKLLCVSSPSKIEGDKGEYDGDSNNIILAKFRKT